MHFHSALISGSRSSSALARSIVASRLHLAAGVMPVLNRTHVQRSRTKIFSFLGSAMAIYRLIANGSFGPDEIEVMTTAYEAALIEVPVADRNDPMTELIAKSIVNVTASGERDPKQVMERALNALGVRPHRRFAKKLPIGAIWTRWPRAVITLSFVPLCPGYQLTKASANLVIENLL